MIVADEHLYTLGDTASNTAPEVNAKVSDITVSIIIDTGASMDIMDEKKIRSE